MKFKPEAVDGEKRTRRRFAWFPTRMTDGSRVVVWLERYEHTQQFIVINGLYGEVTCWTDGTKRALYREGER